MAGRVYGCSLVGVGIASLAFHASSGPARPVCRQLDYYAIALSTSAFLRAAAPRGVPGAPLTALALAGTPVSPLGVAALNGLVTEAALTARAARYPQLRRMQLYHSLAGFVSGAAWLADDVLDLPLAHAVWHLGAFFAADAAHRCLLPRREIVVAAKSKGEEPRDEGRIARALFEAHARAAAAAAASGVAGRTDRAAAAAPPASAAAAGGLA